MLVRFSPLSLLPKPSCILSSLPTVPRYGRDSPHLSLGQTQSHRQLRLPPHGDVAVALKLSLQLQALLVTVHHPVFVLGAGLPS